MYMYRGGVTILMYVTKHMLSNEVRVLVLVTQAEQQNNISTKFKVI